MIFEHLFCFIFFTCPVKKILPVQNRFYPSKWWVDRSLHKAMVLTAFRVRPQSQQDLNRNEKMIIQFPGDGALWVRRTSRFSHVPSQKQRLSWRFTLFSHICDIFPLYLCLLQKLQFHTFVYFIISRWREPALTFSSSPQWRRNTKNQSYTDVYIHIQSPEMSLYQTEKFY